MASHVTSTTAVRVQIFLFCGGFYFGGCFAEQVYILQGIFHGFTDCCG